MTAPRRMAERFPAKYPRTPEDFPAWASQWLAGEDAETVSDWRSIMAELMGWPDPAEPLPAPVARDLPATGNVFPMLANGRQLLPPAIAARKFTVWMIAEGHAGRHTSERLSELYRQWLATTKYEPVPENTLRGAMAGLPGVASEIVEVGRKGKRRIRATVWTITAAADSRRA